MSNFPPQGGFPDQGGFGQGGVPPPPKKSNMKWFLIAGGGCLLLVIVAVVGIVALIGGGVYMLANSEASLAAQAFVQQSGTVKAELGEPLTTSFSGGNIETNNGVGKATINVAVSGPKGAGTVTLTLASSGNGPWSVNAAEFVGPNGKMTKLK